MRMGGHGIHEPRIYELRAAEFAEFYSEPCAGALNLVPELRTPNPVKPANPAARSS